MFGLLFGRTLAATGEIRSRFGKISEKNRSHCEASNLFVDTWLLFICAAHHMDVGGTDISLPGQFLPDNSPGQFPLSTRTIPPPISLKTQLENYIYTYMYAHMHTYIHTCIIIHIDVCTHAYTHTIHTCIHTYIYSCLYIYVYIYTYIVYSHTNIQMYMSVYVCTYMYACIYMHVYVCMYMCVYVCVYVCAYLYACMYVCICVYAYMLMYVCIIYGGIVPGEMSYQKREGELSGGNCPILGCWLAEGIEINLSS